ncbi:hypothetical protein PR048_010064 [Dryococelus australis]|uniref:Uncharacterized protein n=1 Tax=Dryococelus australis TaxID=614101 RepID=A0ABQ9I1M6_9NEOP|nr:hypothetical protein PR048_010064 [Dryococelus australis]
MIEMYRLRKYSNLNETCYYRFTSMTSKSCLKSDFLQKLQLTSEAVRQHLLRINLQVQHWIGNKHPRTDWEKENLFPVPKPLPLMTFFVLFPAAVLDAVTIVEAQTLVRVVLQCVKTVIVYDAGACPFS